MGKIKRIENGTGYLLALAAFLFCFFMFKSYFFLMGIVVLIAFGIADMVALQILYQNLNVKLKGRKEDSYTNVRTRIGIGIENKSCFFSNNIYLRLSIVNEFYGETSEHIINLPVAAKECDITEFPMEFAFLGKMKIVLTEIRLSGMLGIWERKRQPMEELIFYVYPKELVFGNEPEKYDGIRQREQKKEEESEKRGREFSEITGIREYVPGDRLKDIHWKLSGKKGELLVMERASRSNTGETLLLELADIRIQEKNQRDDTEEKRCLEEVIKVFLEFSTETLEHGIPIELVWWDKKKQEMRSRELVTKENLYQALIEIFEAGCYREANKLKQYWKREHIGGCLWTGVLEQAGAQKIIVKGKSGAVITREE